MMALSPHTRHINDGFVTSQGILMMALSPHTGHINDVYNRLWNHAILIQTLSSSSTITVSFISACPV